MSATDIDLAVLIERARKLTQKQRAVFEAIARAPRARTEEHYTALGISASAYNERVVSIYAALGLPKSMGLLARRDILVKILACENTSVQSTPESAKPNGHDHGPPAYDAPITIEAPSLPAGAGCGLSVSVSLANPSRIIGIRRLSLEAADFESKLSQYVKEGYQPELLNEFQSLQQPDIAAVSVILIKRR